MEWTASTTRTIRGLRNVLLSRSGGFNRASCCSVCVCCRLDLKCVFGSCGIENGCEKGCNGV